MCFSKNSLPLRNLPGSPTAPLTETCIQICGPPQALIPLALDNTAEGKVKAAQALAKIAITSNPEMAFPGERVTPSIQKHHRFRSSLALLLKITVTLFLRWPMSVHLLLPAETVGEFEFANSLTALSVAY